MPIPSHGQNFNLVHPAGNDPASSALQAVTHPSMSKVRYLVPPVRFERTGDFSAGLQNQCNRPLCEGGETFGAEYGDQTLLLN